MFFKKSNFLLKKKEYENKLKQAEENKKYNEEQLPKDIQEYEQNYKTMCDEQIKIINSSHKKIGEYFAKIEEIDIVSITQAKYAQNLLDYIYKGAANIKEAFEMLDRDKEKIDKQLEEEKLLQQMNIKNEVKEIEQQPIKKGRWKRLSKLAKSMILVPVIVLAIPIILIVVAYIMLNFPSTEVFAITIIAMMALIIGFPIVIIAIFETIGGSILFYRKHKRDLANIINNQNKN